MIEDLPRAADLGEVARILEERGSHQDLMRIVQKALSAHSCQVDLQIARETMEVWQGMQKSLRGAGSSTRAMTEGALLTASVTAYARGTSTNGKDGERGGFDIRKGLKSDEAKTDHQLLLDVRNQVIAHVYPDRVVSGQVWHEIKLAGVEQEGGGWRPGCFARRVGRDDETANRLLRMIPIAQEIIRAALQKRLIRVARELQVATANIDLMALLEAAPFDVVAFVGSNVAARQALNMQLAGGMLSGHM